MSPDLMPWFLTYDLRDILKPVTSRLELVKAVAVLGEKRFSKIIYYINQQVTNIWYKYDILLYNTL